MMTTHKPNYPVCKYLKMDYLKVTAVKQCTRPSYLHSKNLLDKIWKMGGTKNKCCCSFA